MASKTLLLLGVFAFLLVVSEMAAASAREETVQPDGYGGGHGGNGGHYGGGGHGGHGGHGGRGGHGRQAVTKPADTVKSESEQTVQPDQYGTGYPGNGGGRHYGGGGHGGRGGHG